LPPGTARSPASSCSVPYPDHLLLENIAVRPGAQRAGLGRRLLGLAEQEAARLGLAEIRLYTHVTMTENIAFYQRHGYVITHEAHEDEFHRVFMAKQLAARP